MASLSHSLSHPPPYPLKAEVLLVLRDIPVKRLSRVIRESIENTADSVKATAKANRGFCNISALYPAAQFGFEWIKGFLNFASAYV
jgi:hypothetical protein